MSPPSHPDSNPADIKERCSKVFKMPEFRLIGWVGVFGSFPDGEQTAESDVDFIVGFKGETSKDEVYYMADLKEHLLAKRRDVDILYMYNKQPPTFMKAQALLTGKTIYEINSWLRDNRPPAEKLMADTHRRLNAALQLASGISQQAATITKEDTSTLEELIHSVAKLTSILLPQDPDAECLNSYFSPIYNWTTTTLRIIQQHEANGIENLNAEDRQPLLQVLTNDLPERMRVLRSIYLPVLKYVVDRALEVQ